MVSFLIFRAQCNTVLRVAGGWVRDKVRSSSRSNQQLLGLQSNDIDIAVDNMKAEDFALILKQLNVWVQSSRANNGKDPIKKIKVKIQTPLQRKEQSRPP